MFRAVMSDLNPMHLSFEKVQVTDYVTCKQEHKTAGKPARWVDAEVQYNREIDGDFKIASNILFDKNYIDWSQATPATKAALVTLPIFKTIAVLAALTAIIAGITFAATANPLSATAGFVAKWAAIGFGASVALTIASSVVKNYNMFNRQEHRS